MFTIRSDMPAAAPAPDPIEDADVTDAWERALLDHQLAELGRLAAMGMAIAAAIERRATAEDAGPDKALRHAAIDFARVARAVRMTFGVQSRLITEFKARSRPAEAGESDDGPLEVRWMESPNPEREAREYKVQSSIRRAATAAGHGIEAVERLAMEAAERLEDDDIQAVMTHAVDDIVAMICKELGLEAASTVNASSPVSGSERGRGPRRGGGGVPPHSRWRQNPLCDPPELRAESGPAPARPRSHCVTAPPRAGEHASVRDRRPLPPLRGGGERGP